MINIFDKHNCCGCGACAQRCPKQCISLKEDEEGFLYPVVDAGICIDCGLCEKVCPVINQNKTKHPLKAYAAINPVEEIRSKSSSGGIFTAIAEKVISEGGVVFGARFDDKWEVEHSYSETREGLDVFRGSKYVQSRIGKTYQQVEEFLENGRKVLFSGTSCQIAGLKHFLQKEYEYLVTVDVVCHGVPSPKLWREYLSTIAPTSKITHISMKDKAKSWRGYNITINGKEKTFSERASQNKYMLAFYPYNCSLRPSCYQCPAKAGKSESDITLADYWGVEKLIPEMDDNRGTSFVCANTEIGDRLLQSLSYKSVLANYTASVPYNICIERSTKEPAMRASFWSDYQNRGIDALLALKPKKSSILKRFLRRIIKQK